MKLGALLMPSSADPATGELAERARRFEDAGFDSLWTVQAIGRGMMVADPFVALAAAAAVTERIALGTAVVQLPLYPAADLAHRVFSLMHLAGDRFSLGLGAGSTERDFAAVRRPFDERFRAFDATLSELRSLLDGGSAGDTNLTPWPNVSGGPPLLYGTWGAGVERAAREFSGWIASALHRTPDEVIAKLPAYRAAGGTRAVVSSIRVGAEETAGEHRALLERFAEAGFDEAVLLLLPGAPEPAAIRDWVPT